MVNCSISRKSKMADSSIDKASKVTNSSISKTFKMTASVKSKNVDVAAINRKLGQFRDRGRKLGLSDEEIYNCFELSASQSQVKLRRFLLKAKLKFLRPIKLLWLKCSRFRRKLVVLPVFAAVVLMVSLGLGAHTTLVDVIYHTECLVENNAFISEMLRPPLSCTFCQNLTAVPTYDDISKDTFTRQHGYNGVPVLVKGACKNWTAVNIFSYLYFKGLYTRRPETLQDIQSDCQFFSYDSDLSSLDELFGISDDRAAYKDGEDRWYVGWVNCDPEIADELITHYHRPHFLPSDSYNDYKIWIFIGWPGYGAGTHIDFVQLPSWQAQIAGTKTWELIPSPECEQSCHSLSVTVETGDIYWLTTTQESDAERKEVRKEVLQLRDRGRSLGLSDEDIFKLFENHGKWTSPDEQPAGVFRGYRLPVQQKLFSVETLTMIVVVFLACRLYRATHGGSLMQAIYGSKCILPANPQILAIVAPLASCDHCKNLTHVPTLDGEISGELFQRYVVSDVPVIMRGAAKNWSALTTFSHQYFKQLYEGRDSTLLNQFSECQFLQYSDLGSVAELLNISSDRAAFKDGERWWYAGWIVCDPYVDTQLRRHFAIPACIRALDSKKHKLWLFVGPHGPASATHLDNVKHPSWQAQIAGKKTWTLSPSPECENLCKTFSVTVEPGDLLFVHTDVWFHSTYIWPGDISITLASEFNPMDNHNQK